MGRIAGVVLVLVGLAASSGEALAQQWVTQGAQCSPPCRDGYSCVNGTCAAVCNPPCPAGTVCIDGRYCEAVDTPCNPPCPAGSRCVDGRRCEPESLDCSPPCRDGFVCSGGQCVDAGGPATPATPVEPATPVPPTGATEPATEPPPAADADETDDSGASMHSILVKLRLGLGGSVSWLADVRGTSQDGTGDETLVASVGVAVEKDWMVSLGRVSLGIGLLGSGLWWNTSQASDSGFGRSTLIEIDGVPKASYELLPRLFLYVAVPVGLTISFLRDNLTEQFNDTSVGFGWNLSVVLGAQYELGLLGVFAELGVDTHHFSNGATAPIGGADIDVELDFTQFAFNLGLAF